MTDYGIKVSKDGDDVKTAADKDLLFTSKHNTLKILTSRKDTISAGGSLAINHGLGYTPIFMVYVYNGTNWEPVDNTGSYTAYVSSTAVGLYNGSGSSRDFRTIIFIDRITS